MTNNHIVQPPAGQLQAVGLQATGRVIANFALQHLTAAALFRNHVARVESQNAGQSFGAFFEDIQSYGSACIMSSAAALEAFINELFIAPSGKLRSLIADFEADFWGRGGIERKSILDKYQQALAMLNMPELDEDMSPYRDAWGLIELRNALVHFKPTWDPVRRRQIELEEALAGQFALSPFPGAGADFVTMKCMSAGCASWAVATVVGFVREFDSRAQLDAKKIGAFTSVGS